MQVERTAIRPFLPIGLTQDVEVACIRAQERTDRPAWAGRTPLSIVLGGGGVVHAVEDAAGNVRPPGLPVDALRPAKEAITYDWNPIPARG
ncbi:hypothetical protein ROP_27820 [Rhodococcus opacus B4]|uniref:Uncharacterized protein n=1 Tax=Rhodococcus opacus (strain B4) TaxID=632772 RepID=C1B5A3_RHOOB|nr:hypothetical protein ROP_27820 [Rhodococcus opacus B4]